VLGVDSTFSSSRFEKSFLFIKAGGEKELPKTRTLDENERMKKEDEKAQTEESFIFPSKREERETTCILLQKRV